MQVRSGNLDVLFVKDKAKGLHVLVLQGVRPHRMLEQEGLLISLALWLLPCF